METLDACGDISRRGHELIVNYLTGPRVCSYPLRKAGRTMQPMMAALGNTRLGVIEFEESKPLEKSSALRVDLVDS